MMKKKIKRGNEKGFTLIELILVITIIGILAVTALPRFFSLTTEAEQASRDGVLGAVRAGIALFRANDMAQNGGAGTYPATLDAQANGACATCFNSILATGVNDASWARVSDTVYSFNDGTATTNYTYDPAAGTFQ